MMRHQPEWENAEHAAELLLDERDDLRIRLERAEAVIQAARAVVRAHGSTSLQLILLKLELANYDTTTHTAAPMGDRP